jgi:hypothetical protein
VLRGAAGSCSFFSPVCCQVFDACLAGFFQYVWSNQSASTTCLKWMFKRPVFGLRVEFCVSLATVHPLQVDRWAKQYQSSLSTQQASSSMHQQVM